MAPAKVLQGDPKRSGETSVYKMPAPTASSADFLTIAGSICGVAGILLKMKLGSWAALFCCLASLAHMKTGDLQSKHLMMSLMFAVFCLFNTYRAAFMDEAIAAGRIDVPS